MKFVNKLDEVLNMYTQTEHCEHLPKGVNLYLYKNGFTLAVCGIYILYTIELRNHFCGCDETFRTRTVRAVKVVCIVGLGWWGPWGVWSALDYVKVCLSMGYPIVMDNF